MDDQIDHDPQLHKTDPEFYERPLSKQASEDRANVEAKLDSLYAELRDAGGVERLKLVKRIDRLEQQLAWQGANPKELDIADLAAHIREGYPDDEAVAKKYASRIKNRATAIRAYCVQCQGGEVAEVRRCPALTCPLHPFRMGKDPLRGWDIPKPEVEPEIEDDLDDTQFEEDDDDDTDDTD